MEFPNEIKEYIFSYFPHPYKKPSHLDAINKNNMFVDMKIDRELTLEIQEENDSEFYYPWLNSYIEYKKYRNEALAEAFSVMQQLIFL